jgi:hypothetical protein
MYTNTILWLYKMIPIKGYTRIHPTIDWIEISGNETPEAMRLLEAYPENRNWYRLSANSLATDLLKNNPDKINYTLMSNNHCPDAIRIIQRHRTAIDVAMMPLLSSNPFAFEWLLKIGQIRWPYICRNPSKQAKRYLETRLSTPSPYLEITEYPHVPNMHYLELNLSSWAPIMWDMYYTKGAYHGMYKKKPTWKNMSANPYFAELLLSKYPEQISWSHFSANPNPLAVHYLLDHTEKIDMYFAEANPHPAMVQYVLKQIANKGARVDFSRNTCPLALHYLAPVVYDYEAMRESRAALHAEIMGVAWSPEYLTILSNRYNVTFEEIAYTRM